jgi:molybdate transport system substrate-binding protein
MRTRLALLFLTVALVSACSYDGGGGGATTSQPARPSVAESVAAATPSAPASVEPVELTVFGAASLKGALEEAKAAYEAASPGTTITVSTDSSAALETQIEQGAPADVFLSADTTNPKKLVDGGFASGDAVVFARNELTIIVPTDNPGGVASPIDLAKPRLKIIAAGDEVPITKYATQLVQNLAGHPGYPAGFEGAYAANVASKEDNVKAVVAKIELGEGDAGIVYVTDAAASDKVASVDVPSAANVPATYAGVVVKDSPNQEAAAAFLDWFAGPEGRAILADFGFLAPPP